MARTKTAPVTYPALTVCTNFDCATGLKMTSRIESSSIRIVLELKCAPVGFCIQAFAMRIHNADKLLPMATSHVTTRCWRRLKRSQPKKKRPMNVPSRKNAIKPSMASGTPKMSPT